VGLWMGAGSTRGRGRSKGEVTRGGLTEETCGTHGPYGL